MTDGSFGSLVSLTLLALFAAGFALSNRRPPVFRFPLPRRPLSLSRVLAVLAASSLVAVGSVKPGSQPERLFHGALLRLESLLPTNSFPFGRATWPFDAPTAGVVSNLAATGENAIPDAMLGTGLALCSVAAEPAPVGPASGFAVPHWLPFDADNRCVSAALPFAFPFGDATFDRVDILSNGRLSFGGTTLRRRSASGFPPLSPENPGARILAPAWGDTVLAARNGAEVLVDARTNAFTVTWRNALNPSAPWATNAAFSCTLLPTGDAEWRYSLPEPAFATNLSAGVQSGTNAWALFDGIPPPWLATNGTVVARLSRVGTDWFLEDADGDGLGNGEEFLLGTDPYKADTDGDGPDDLWELARGHAPDVADIPPTPEDSDGDGVPDAWEARMGTNPDALTTLWPCSDSDGDGFTDEYETLFLESDPHDAASPEIPDADEAAVLYCEVGSDRPCWLVLSYNDDTNRTDEVRVAWLPGISPDCVSLVVEAARPASVALEREETGGYWSGTLDLGGAGAFALEKTTSSDGGWFAPEAAGGEAWDVDVWRLGSPAEDFDFCHLETYAEIWLTSLAHYGGGVTWSSVPEGISGTGNPLVFNPSEVPIGAYDVTVSARATTGTAEGRYTVNIRALRLQTALLVCNADDATTNSIPIDTGNSFIPEGESYYVTSEPEGIDSLEFVPAELEAGRRYAVDVWNGDCGYATATVLTTRVECRPTATWPDYPRSDLGVGELLTCTVTPGDVSVTWACDETKAVFDDASSAATTLRVLDVPGALTVTANVEGLPISTNFLIHAPEGIAYSKPHSPHSFASDASGVGCKLYVYLAPANVSFENVMMKEEVCSATNYSGWFAERDSRRPPHDTNHGAGGLLPLTNDDEGSFFIDNISSGRLFGPWSPGAVEWHIPIKWCTTPTNLHAFCDGAIMRVELDSFGTVKITKFGSSATRSVGGVSVLIDSKEVRQ